MPKTKLPLRHLIAGAAALLFATAAMAQGADAQLSALMAGNRWPEALTLIDANLKKNPADVPMQMNRGAVLSNMNRVNEALAVFKKVATENPDLPAPHNNMAVLLAAKGQFEEARSALERAIRTHPTYATAYENLGDLYSHMAGDAYRKALQFDKSLKTAKPKLEMVNELTALARGPDAARTAAAPQLPPAKPGSTVVAQATPAPAPTPVAAPAPAPAATPAPAAVAAAKPAPAPAPAVVAPAASASKPATVPKPTVVAAAPVAAPAAAPAPVPKPAPAVAPASAAKPASAAAVAAAPSPAPAAAATAATDATAKPEIEAALNAWAAAWSGRDMAAYAAAYDADFKGKAASHAAWLNERRDRIAPRKHIEVKLSNLQVQVKGEQATAQFRQDYVSDSLSTQSSKTLLLRKVGGKWLIQQETSGR